MENGPWNFVVMSCFTQFWLKLFARFELFYDFAMVVKARVA